MEDKPIKIIRKTSLFLISGIFAIIAFFNTAAIQQAVLLNVSTAELGSIIAWIDGYTLHLLISGCILIIGMFPLHEVVETFLLIFGWKKELPTKWFDFMSVITFFIGSIYLFTLFILYIITF